MFSSTYLLTYSMRRINKPGNVLTSMTAYRPVTFSMMTSMPNRSRPNVCWSLMVKLRSFSASGLNTGCSNSLSSIFTHTQQQQLHHLTDGGSFFYCIWISGTKNPTIFRYLPNLEIDRVRFNIPPNTLWVISGTGFCGSNDPTTVSKHWRNVLRIRLQSHQVHTIILQ